MPALARSVAARRESPTAKHIPYTAQVSAHVIRTENGEFIQTFRIGGASFESGDDAELNNWHERLNVPWRNLASPHVTLWIHVVRRRERASTIAPAGRGFADVLAAGYQQRLSQEILMVNELYLSLVYRPLVGVATGILASLVRQRAATTPDEAEALESCEKLAQQLLSALDRYEPERLDIRCERGRPVSELLEFLGLLINGETQSIPLPRAPVREVLATSRVLFGTEAIEYRTPTATRLAAALGIKEDPTPSGVCIFDALLSAPFPFVLTQSFS